ncbi:MAG: hypothetical protein ACREOH_12405 [Candidatus Entotheonellia bacterium]
MPTYFSMHIIACLTRQALTQLISTLQATQEVTLVRASASQMGGRLLCEYEAPDQETLLEFLAAQRMEYEWIIREEMRWESQPSGTAPGEGHAGPSAAGEARAAPQPLPRPGEAKILHILRSLKDESAWEIIGIQRATQPVVVLLLQDAVLAPPPLDVPMFACEADVQARGLPSSVPLVTYDQIVELIFACERVMVW